MTRTRQIPYSRSIITLAAIPSVDAILNQLSGAFHWALGPVSILQAFRGGLLLWFLFVIGHSLFRDFHQIARMPYAAVAALGVLGIALSKELILSNTVASESAVAYGQMAYWVLLWIVVSHLCENPEQARFLLWGLAVAAIITALSVVLGYAVGSMNFYEADDVHSSAGWFNTAKMISGILVSGMIIILYLGHDRRSWLFALLAALCAAACFMTYARAGTVAMGAVTLLLVLWLASSVHSREWRSLRIFLLIVVCAGSVVSLAAPVETMLARWSDLGDGDHAGSGRAAIWQVATESFARAPNSEQLLGNGYSAMSETLLRGYGDDVKHTHNDLLDMLLVAGSLGVLWLGSFIATLSLRTWQASFRSIEGAAAAAVLVNFLCHSQLTGQIWGTDAMTYYVVSLSAFFEVARHAVPMLRESQSAPQCVSPSTSYAN